MRAMGLSATLITSAPASLQQAGAGQQLVGRQAARGIHLDGDGELAAGQFFRQDGRLEQRFAGIIAFSRCEGEAIGVLRGGCAIQRLADDLDMLGCGTAAAADDGCAILPEGQGVIAEIIRLQPGT